mmetsp:Transcript_30903/g.71217  ORF Transcript_30903/g.71217 Transcript_30903/m.71217 type:complete len:291 (-) Transcript_30903:728-1600(-)
MSILGIARLQRSAPVVVLGRHNSESIGKNAGGSHVPLVRAPLVVVARGTGLRDRGNLDALHDVSAVAHAVLDCHSVARGRLPHLHEPGARERGVGGQRAHVVVLVVQPVLLVHPQTPQPTAPQQVVPELLLKRESVVGLRVDKEIPVPAVLSSVGGVRSPVPVVSLHHPASTVVQRIQPFRKDAGHCRPVLDTIPDAFVVPPAVEQHPAIWNTNSRSILGNIAQRLPVVLAILGKVVIVSPIVGGVAQVVGREVRVTAVTTILAITRKEHITPGKHRSVHAVSLERHDMF